MSQADDGIDQAALAAAYEILNVSTTIEIAAAALYLYEYFLTLSKEVQCVWRRKLSVASVLFVLNRYVVLGNRMIRLVQAVSWAGFTETEADRVYVPFIHLSLCSIVWRFIESATLIMYITVAAFAGLRMFAIWGMNVRIGVCVALLGLINPCINIYYNTTLVFRAVPPPFTGCGQETKLPYPSADLLFFILGSVFTLLFESAVLGLTWAKTADTVYVFKQKPESENTTSYLLLRDGTMYFATLVVLTIISLLSIRIDAFNNVPALTDTLISICISRFLLNLRESYASAQGGSSADSEFRSRMSEVRFAPTNPLVDEFGGQIMADSDLDCSDDESGRHIARRQTYKEEA